MRVPSGAKARFRANVAAVERVRELERSGRDVSAGDQEVLAAWSGWGAVAGVFEGREDWADEATLLRELLTAEEWAAARANTLSAFYTDPAIASAMWRAVESTGMPGESRFLEPGCGTGTFMGQAPEGVSFIGVEVDPLTARIAHYLHPDAQIRSEGFESTRVLSGMVDGAIGNVPFGSFSLHDPVHNPARLPIHSHFIVKSLAATRPGGLVAVVTSAWTMDAANGRGRSELAKLGKLVAAARLPGQAFARSAGTDVTTDVLVFQRREEDVAAVDLDEISWGRVTPVDDELDVKINEYFVRFPDRVLGEAGVASGPFGPQLRVTGNVGEELAAELQSSLVSQLEQAGVVWPTDGHTEQLAPGETGAGLFEPVPAEQQPVVGELRIVEPRSAMERRFGAFVRWTGQAWEGAKVPRSAQEETRALLGVRDAVRRVLATQADKDSTPAERDRARSRLNDAYDGYVGRFGPINRFTMAVRAPGAVALEREVSRLEREWRSGLPEWMDAEARASADPGDELRGEWAQAASDELTGVRKDQRHLAPLAGDPGLGGLLGIEVFDEESQTARKSLIFSQDIVAARTGTRVAESVDDAVAISMDERQRVDLERVGELLGVSVDEVPERLVGSAFKDPESGDWVPSALYLSGRVREKLEVAREAAAEDPALRVNVAALEGVVPAWIGIEQIDLSPGVNVLEASDYAAFARETFGVECEPSRADWNGTWKIASPSAGAFSDDVMFRYGTNTRKPTELLEALMNQRPVVVRYKDSATQKMIVDRAETTAARTKQDAITARFSEWVLERPELRERVEKAWNERFNQDVAPDFSSLGERLALPGLSAAFVPHPHQREAVARVIHSPATLLNHVVGAGKTGTMVMAAMEMRRTGQVRKPWMVVPNHLVEQTTREAAQWYPGARLLAFPTGLSHKERQTWIARSAAQDWDIVIVPQSVFKAIGVAPALSHAWTKEQIRELEDAMSSMGSGDRVRIKQLEGKIKTLSQRASKLLSAKDTGLTFEQTGCDYLLIDEAHHYKNLMRESDVADLNCTGSQLASDLDMKIHALRQFRTEIAKRDGTWREGMVPHVVDFATGTPVANNMAELWVMQRYLRPDLQEAQGTDSLREWARAFARSSQALEMGADATWQVRDRVRAFANVPELMASNRAFMSTVAKEDLSFALPSLVGGERQVHVRPASEEVVAYVRDLKARADAPGPDDNILKVLGDGRLVAIDPQMRGLPADADGGRAGLVADAVAATWERTKDREYLGVDGSVDPIRGSLQIVFCDQGIPGGEAFNLYGYLKEQMVARGMAPETIAFIHDAVDDAARGELFEKCRDGRVNVLIGSTQRMGTGVNVQKRAVALHHVDVPWRPADLEQREGRLIRQGNQNAEVEVHTYITQSTLDSMMWQTIERKASFIGQLMRGETTGRTFEQDDDDLRRLAGALAAVAADNPLVMERAEVMNTVMQLEALASSHRTAVGSMRSRLLAARGQIPVERVAAEEKNQLSKRVAPGPLYEAPGGGVFEKPGEASEALRDVLMGHRAAIAAGDADGTSIGMVRGVEFVVRGRGDAWRLEASGAPSVGFDFAATPDAIAGMQFVARLDNRLRALDEDVPLHRAKAAELAETVRDLEDVLERQGEFAQAAELEAAMIRLTEIDAELGLDDADGEVEDPMVFEAALQVLGDRAVPTHGRGLRVGDVFRFGSSREHFVVVEVNESGEVLARADGDESGKTRRVGEHERVEFVARRRAALTPWEALVVEAGPRDRVALPAQLTEGTRVKCGSASGEIVEGTVRARGELHIVEFDRVDADLGAEARYPYCFAEDFWTPEEVAEREAIMSFPEWNSVPAGSVIVRAWDRDGERVEGAEGAARSAHGPSAVRDDGTIVSRMIARAEVTPPKLITERSELTTIGLDRPVAVTELRSGDRVPVRQVDRDARSDRIVTVVQASGQYASRSAETAYVTDDGVRSVGRMKPESMVDVTARSEFMLELGEALAIAQARGIELQGVSRVDQDALPRDVDNRPAILREGGADVVGRLSLRRPTAWTARWQIVKPDGRRVETRRPDRILLVDEAQTPLDRVAAVLSRHGVAREGAGASGRSEAVAPPELTAPPAPSLEAGARPRHPRA